MGILDAPALTRFQGDALYAPKTQRAGYRISGGGSTTTNNSVQNLHARVVFRLPVRAKQMRLHVWNHDVKANGANTSGAINFVGGFYTGLAALDATGAPTTSFTAAPTKVADPFTTPADGATESVTPWVSIDVLPGRDYLLAWGLTCAAGTVHQRSQGVMNFISSTASEATNGPAMTTPSGSMSTTSIFHDVWIEYQTDAGTAHGLMVGDSLTVGTSSPLPHRDGYAVRASTELGIACTVAAWHGTTLQNDWLSTSGPKWGMISAITKPAFVDIGLGSNDFANSRTLAQVQADLGTLGADLRTVLGAEIPIYVRTIMPRGLTGQPETDRLAFNAWLRDRPFGIAGMFDIATLVTNTATGNTLISGYDGGDGTHLNKVGYQLISTACRPPLRYVPALA